MKDMPEQERSIVEMFRIVALQYVDAECAANMLEEFKSTKLEQMKTDVIESQGEMPDNRAERIVKASADWETFMKEMIQARSKALKLKLQLDFLRMKERQEDRMGWLERSERKMGRSVT